MTRVLVTGSDGFVGTHVTRQFAENRWDVIPLDIGDRFPRQAADVIVSLAATADPGEALRDPAGAYANSTGIMVETLEYARKHGARVLHISTNEAHPPVGPYGGAKACQEIICETYPDVPVAIVVTQSLFGERQQRNKLVPTAIRSILKREPIRLQRESAGWATRPFLHVHNLTEALVRLIRGQYAPPRVHIGATESLSVREAVAELEQALGISALVEAVPAGDRVGHDLAPAPIGCDLPGWQPRYKAKPALRNVARWYQAHPEHLYEVADPDTSYAAPPRVARKAA